MRDPGHVPERFVPTRVVTMMMCVHEVRHREALALGLAAQDAAQAEVLPVALKRPLPAHVQQRVSPTAHGDANTSSHGVPLEVGGLNPGADRGDTTGERQAGYGTGDEGGEVAARQNHRLLLDRGAKPTTTTSAARRSVAMAAGRP